MIRAPKAVPLSEITHDLPRRWTTYFPQGLANNVSIQGRFIRSAAPNPEARILR